MSEELNLDFKKKTDLSKRDHDNLKTSLFIKIPLVHFEGGIMFPFAKLTNRQL